MKALTVLADVLLEVTAYSMGLLGGQDGTTPTSAITPTIAVAPRAAKGPRPRAAITPREAVRDFSLPASGTILNLVLADWYTNPRRLAESLFLLNDPPSEPPGTPRPALRQVVIDGRTVPRHFVPAIPGIATMQDVDGKLTGKRELRIYLSRFEPRADGTVAIEFVESNYGYTSNRVQYRAFPKGGQYRVEYMASDLSDFVTPK